MRNQEIPIIHPEQNEIRVSFLQEKTEENKNLERNHAVLQEVVTAYNNTVNIKGKTITGLFEIFSQKLQKDPDVKIVISMGFMALYSHYGYNKITDNLKGISKEINRNDKFRHYIKSMFCCCLRNYRSTVENKKDFKQFIHDCEELHLKIQQQKEEKLKIGTALQEYIKNKQERLSILPDGI